VAWERLAERPERDDALDRATVTMATQRTRAAGNQSGDAPTAARSIEFDARDRLLGRLDDLPVRRAAEGGLGDATPAPNGFNHPEENAL